VAKKNGGMDSMPPFFYVRKAQALAATGGVSR
jgi:hypothetical protein